MPGRCIARPTPTLATARPTPYSPANPQQVPPHPVKRPPIRKPRAAAPDATAAAPTPLPSRDEIRRFIQSAPGRVGKRDIARAFHLGPEHQVALKGILKSLAQDTTIAPAGHKRFTAPTRLPETTIVVVTGTDPGRRPHRPPGILAASVPAPPDPHAPRASRPPGLGPR